MRVLLVTQPRISISDGFVSMWSFVTVTTIHYVFVILQKYMPDARGRSKSAAADDAIGRDVQITAAHWLSLSVLP